MTRRAQARGRGIAIVSGILFWYPLAGVTYQFLHYLIGLRRLGFQVYYIEDSGRWVYDPVSRQLTPDARANIARVEPVLRAHGLDGVWAFRGAYRGGECFGMSPQKLAALYRDADVMLNVTGAQELREEHMRIKRRLYVETDPFASQVRLAQGDERVRALVDAHDTWFTYGENVGQPECLAPTDRPWLPTRQPVVIDLWAPARFDTSARSYRTLATWHNEGKSVSYRGEVYHWTKDREFIRYAGLPARRPHLAFELATDADSNACAQLRANGFGVRDAPAISSDAAMYRTFIRESRAEFTVARDQYVRPRTGWFSDRSACYLAAGRPVVTEDTGLSKRLPVGRGLFTFHGLDDVVCAIDAIEANYLQHCQAAVELARAYFAAENVLGDLLQRAGL